MGVSWGRGGQVLTAAAFAACACPKPPLVVPLSQCAIGTKQAEFVINEHGVTRCVNGQRGHVQIALQYPVTPEFELVLVADGRPRVIKSALNKDKTFELPLDATARDYWRVTVRVPSQEWLDTYRTALGALPASHVHKPELDLAVEHESYYIARSFADSIADRANDLVHATSTASPAGLALAARRVVARLPIATSEVASEIAAANIGRSYPVAAAGLAAVEEKIRELREAAARLAAGNPDPAPFVKKWLAFQSSVPRPKVAACTETRKFNAARDPALEALWTLGTFSLPATDAAHTIEVAVDQSAPSHFDLLSEDNDLNVWAPTVPRDLDLTFKLTAGRRANLRFLDVVASALPVLVSGFKSGSTGLASKSAAAAAEKLTAAKMIEQVLDILPGYPEKSPEQELEASLRAFTSIDACAEQGRGDNGLDALADTTSRVATISSLAGDPIDRDLHYSLDACKGSCTEETTIGHVQLRAHRRWSWTLLGTLAYNLHVHRWHAGSFTSYQWQPDTISNGTQLFQLEPQPQPLQSLSSMLFVAAHDPDNRWAFGFGPSILLGDGSGKLAQWTANVFLAPWASWRKQRVYLTAGAGFRLHDAPIAAEKGAVVQGATAPPLAQQLRAEAVVTFGIALDLAAIGDAASGLFGAKTPSTGGPAVAASSTPKKGSLNDGGDR